MEATTPDTKQIRESNTPRKPKKKFTLRSLRLSLKYRPEILKLVLKMRQCIKKKNLLINNLKHQLKEMRRTINKYSTKTSKPDLQNSKSLELKNSSSQTNTATTEPPCKDNNLPTVKELNKTDDMKADSSGWELKPDEEGKSIADQVKEVAQSALQQTGMVYVESAGMYYDYKTGYYYNSELGLYYHTDTSCYYYYNEEKKEFAFHSYPERTATAVNPSLEAHEKRKARKQRKAQNKEEDIDSLAKNLAQGDGPNKAKRRKKTKKPEKGKDSTEPKDIKEENVKPKDETSEETDDYKDKELPKADEEVKKEAEEMEDGECSETGSESEQSSDEESSASTASLDNDDAIAKHHPPCMRIIVRETKLPKLKVGSLFLITKDGGSVGREGEQHTILLRDQNVSRNHLEIKYDMDKRMYVATDLGSKNGTFLNGVQMADSQMRGLPMEVMHGSIIQLGETKLLCHVHPGNDTCGHCEPGLIMETQEKEKVAYTRTCDVKKQYELELARLKNKYKPEPLMIEDGSYNDRARARREAIGSSHHSEKTQSTDVETHIAPENKGFKLLEKMGWSKGEGLGKDNQGETAPIPLLSNEGKVGLGAPGSSSAPPLVPVPKIRNTLGPATLRLASRSKMLQAPAKVFQDPEEVEDE